MPDFKIRLNGAHVPQLRVEQDEEGSLQLVVRDEQLGWLTVDGNEGIHPALPRFVLEYRDETAWALVPIEMKRASADKGWQQATPGELIEIFQSTGVIQ